MSLQEIENLIETSPYVQLTHKADLEPVTSFPIANNCMTIAVGATGSGKSYVLKEIFKKVPYDVIFFISPTASFDQTRESYPCKWFITNDNPNDGVDMIFDYIYRRIQVAHLIGLCNATPRKDVAGRGKILEEIEELTEGYDIEFFNLKNRIAVVLDDCGYQTKEMKGQQSPLSKLIMIRRHLGVSVYLALQSYTQVAKEIRRQASDVIITKAVSSEDLRNLYKELTNLPFKEIIMWPRYFIALIQGLMADKRYSSTQFLRGGIYCDFEPVDKEEVLEIIKNYDNIRKA